MWYGEEEMRSEFEKLPEIKMFINAFELDMISNEYKYKDGKGFGDHALGFFNGAWYAYQEQQKRIDEAMRLLNTRKHNADIANLIFKIQSEVLK